MLLLFVALGSVRRSSSPTGLAPKVLGLAGIAIVALAGVAYRVMFLQAKLNGNGPTLPRRDLEDAVGHPRIRNPWGDVLATNQRVARERFPVHGPVGSTLEDGPG
jgi:hypothetical protein